MPKENRFNTLSLSDPILYIKNPNWKLVSWMKMSMTVPKINIFQYHNYMAITDKFNLWVYDYKEIKGISVNKHYKEMAEIWEDWETAVILKYPHRLPRVHFAYKVEDRYVRIMYSSDLDENDWTSPYSNHFSYKFSLLWEFHGWIWWDIFR